MDIEPFLKRFYTSCKEYISGKLVMNLDVFVAECRMGWS